MYKGIKRKYKHEFNIKIPTKIQIIELEETITNGIISQNYKVKTHDYAADPNVKWQDFEVANLQAAGINVQGMKPITMTPNLDKLEANAETATQIIEQYEIIKELEQQNNDTKQE